MNAVAPVVFALSIAIAAPLHAADANGNVNSLVAAEKAFAAMSVSKGMRDAFLANLADSALVFRPGPTPGREAYEKRPAGPDVLSWEPTYAEVSASGDLGWTTGPWSYSRDKDSDPIAFGHFVSVWKKQADGSWKVILDAGNNHDLQKNPPALTVREGTGNGFPDPARSRRSLLGAERAFDDAARENRGAAYADFSGEDVRLYRDGSPPVQGTAAARGVVGEAGLDAPVETSGAVVADSGDLGYTIGMVGSGESYFLRIWRRDADGTWRIVLDLDSPAPTDE